MKNYRVVFFVFFLFSYSGISQNYIKHYTTTNGLPHDVTYGLHQDSKGYIWIGTDNGLAKFNGQEFKVFTIDNGLRTNYVIDITEDNNENIILATWGGGLHVIKEDIVVLPKINNDSIDKIHTIFTHKEHIISPHVSGNLFYEKLEGFEFNKSNLVSNLGMESMVKSLDNKVSYGYLSKLDSIAVLTNHSLTNPKGIGFKGVYELREFAHLKPIFSFLSEKVINSIDVLDNKTYIASERDSIFIFDKFKILQRKKLLINNPFIVKTLITQKREFLILSSDKKGFRNAFLFNSNLDSSINLKKLLKLKCAISDVLEDHEGNIWVSTYGNGLFCLEIDELDTTFFNNDLLPEFLIKSITELDDYMYVLTPNYISKIKESKVETIKLKGFGKDILTHNDSIIVSVLTLEDFRKYKKIKQNAAYKTFYVDSVGLMNYGDSIEIPKYNVRISAEKKTVYDATFYNDTLWFATNLGTFYYDYGLRVLKKKQILDKQLLGNQVTKFSKLKNTLWIATTKGLSKIVGSTITHFTKEQGLINNHINTLYFDHRKYLWIGTQSGLSVYNGVDFFNISQEKTLKSPYVDVIFEDSKHNMWIGGNKGISIIDNSKKLKLKSPPLINIKQHSTTYSYDVISFNRSNDLVSEYKINDMLWKTLLKPNGELNFEDFKKGKYELQFRAKKQDGKWGYTKKHTFNILVPWYRNDFVFTFFILIIACIVIALIILQLKKVKRRNQSLKIAIKTQLELKKEISNVRDNVANDFHDELGNKLARLSFLSKMISNDKSLSDERIRSKINQITEDANGLYTGTRDFIFSLKENSDFVNEVVTYISDFGENYFSKTNIKFILEKDIDINDKLPYFWSKQLIYIFKEAITNTLKHSECSQVTLKFNYVNKLFFVECIDNGIGFSDEQLNSSNGILNMKNRAAKIEGDLIVDSILGEGTTIRFIGKTF